MSALSEFKDRVGSYGKILQEKVFGVNNERLEFVMDSFYKLDPMYRNGVMVGLIGCIASLVVTAIFIYYLQVQTLQEELNATFSALTELKDLKTADATEQARFDKLVDKIRSRTRSLNFKPFFEKLSRQANVPVKSLSDSQPEMDPQNPLSERLKEVHVDIRLAKISIPRLLEFLVDIEKANRYLRVQNLKITGIYGNKLFFDVDVLVRGYQVLR